MQSAVLILLVEGEASHAARIIEVFRPVESVSLHHAKSLKEARAFLAASQPHMILTDWNLPDGGGIELLADADSGMRAPVVLMTASGSEDLAVEAIKSGALDYFVKSPERFKDLPQVISRALREWQTLAGRRQAEEALRQSAQRMRLHIEQTPLAVIEWDTDFRVLQWNPAAEKIFGFTADEAIGQHSDFMIPDTSREHVDRAWHDLLAQQGGHRSTNENMRKDGRIICCEWYNTPLTNADGVVVGVASLARDITERARAEESLQLFKESVENASDAIGMSTPEGVHYYQNKAFTDLFGDIGPDPCASVYVAEHVGREIFRTIMEGGQWSGMVEMYAKDRRVVNIFQRAYANKDQNGRIIGLVGIHTDITVLQRAQEDLRESRNFLAEIQRIVRVGGFKYDFRTGSSFWSDELYQMHGYAPGTVTPSFELHFSHIHPDDQPLASVMRANEEFVPQDVEYRLVSADGTIYYVTTRNRFEYASEGAPRYMYGTIADITDRKLAENAVKTSRDMLETIFQTSPDTIIFSDAVGDIMAANDAVEKVLGYTSQELIGQSYAILAPEQAEDMQSLRENLKDLFEKNFLRDRELIFRKKNGSTIYLECNARVLRDAGGAMTGAVSVMRDITERKKLEAQYRQSQKMEAIGTLAGGIAHDFNNILAAIMGYTELSIEDAARGISVQHNLEQILKSAGRARDLVRQILAFSRKDMEARGPLQVRPLIKEAIKLLRATLPATIEIRETISRQSCLVYANPTQIHQVLMNLCTNAAHAMSENGGVLEIGLSSVFLAEGQTAGYHNVPGGAYVQVTVSDTGTGIDPNYIDRIFEPFFTTKEFGKGTGMGLAVAHGIVKSCGGDIRVRSLTGTGTTFDVLLPELPDAAMEAAPEPPPLLMGTERILLVDDEKMLLDVGQSMLQSLGYKPTIMLSSKSALEWFQRDPGGFDLVITDMTMPHMTGDKLAQKLMRIRPGIPVIMATGYNEKISEETVRELGIRALVMKPFNRREMSQIIRSVLDGAAV
jgi:PAS domain S-box-containing protein